MWSKIKGWLWSALIAIFGVMLTILGIKSRQLKKEKQKTEDLEDKIRQDEADDKIREEVEGIAEQEEAIVNEGTSAIKIEEVEQLVDVASGDKPTAQSYNELIGKWNNEEK